MELLRHIAEVDFFVIVSMVFLSIFLHANEAYDHELNIHIKRTMWTLALLAFLDTMDAFLQERPDPVYLRNICVAGGFIVRPYLLMSVAMMFRQFQVPHKQKLLLLLPCIVNTVIILTFFFHPYVFTIDEHNVLHRHILGYSPHVLSLYYMVYAIKMSMERWQRGFREEAKLLLFSLGFIVLAVVTEIVFSMRGALCGVIGAVLSYYYLYRHMDSSRRDMLTGALNRACFFSDLAKMRPEQMTAFCEFDMNNLKEINDRLGHIEGDKAIIAMHTIIQSQLPLQSNLYRFGGDEFAVLFYDVNMTTVNSTIYRIREEFENSEYKCAIGVAEWKENQTFREVYNEADELMYEDKRRLKSGEKA